MSYNFQTAKRHELVEILRIIKIYAKVHVNSVQTFSRKSKGFLINKIDELCEKHDFLVNADGTIDTGADVFTSLKGQLETAGVSVAGGDSETALLITSKLPEGVLKVGMRVTGSNAYESVITDVSNPQAAAYALARPVAAGDLAQVQRDRSVSAPTYAADEPPPSPDLSDILETTEGPEPVALDHWFREGAALPPPVIEQASKLEMPVILAGDRVTYVDWQSPIVQVVFHYYVTNKTDAAWRALELAQYLGHIETG
jgi:hypothetical protein